MLRFLITGTTATLTLALASAASAQDLQSQIVGVWKLTAYERSETATGKIAKPFGEKPIGHLINTRGGYSTFVFVSGDRKPPAGPGPTDAERVELFKTMTAASGRYRIEGSKSIFKYETSSFQSLTGRETAFTIELTGNRLKVVSPPIKSPVDGSETVVTSTYERLE
jgi:hypothetical protein